MLSRGLYVRALERAVDVRARHARAPALGVRLRAQDGHPPGFRAPSR